MLDRAASHLPTLITKYTSSWSTSCLKSRLGLNHFMQTETMVNHYWILLLESVCSWHCVHALTQDLITMLCTCCCYNHADQTHLYCSRQRWSLLPFSRWLYMYVLHRS